jgi:hypothetical protein
VTDPARSPSGPEHDWDKGFDLTAWRSPSAVQRGSWLAATYGREPDEASLETIYWQRAARYERFQTAWYIGLEPQPFDETLADAVGEVKPEHRDGVIFADTDLRLRVLSAAQPHKPGRPPDTTVTVPALLVTSLRDLHTQLPLPIMSAHSGSNARIALDRRQQETVLRTAYRNVIAAWR